MTTILDKSILLLCSLFLSLCFSPIDSRFQVLMLLGVLIALTLDEFFGTLTYTRIVFFSGLLLCIFLPELLFFLPAFSYPLFHRKRTLLSFLSLPVLLMSKALLAEPLVLCLLLLATVLSFLLGDHTHRITTLSNAFINMQDTDREKQLSLQRQTNALREAQEANIKVATLQERNRIAREIHDNVGHLLSRSLLQVGAMLTVKKDDEALLLLKESLDDAMNGIRSSVHDLRDEALDLEVSVTGLLSDFSDYKTEFEYDIAGPLPSPLIYCFLTITKEALSNIAKHSNADSIHISIKEYSSQYRLSILDNGTDATLSEHSGGMGLENMRSRVASLNGTVRFSNQDGFHIFVSIPKEVRK